MQWTDKWKLDNIVDYNVFVCIRVLIQTKVTCFRNGLIDNPSLPVKLLFNIYGNNSVINLRKRSANISYLIHGRKGKGGFTD